MTKLKEVDCSEKPSEVFLFSEEESIDFEYERIGHVEASGGYGASNKEVLDRLKYEAWRNCANGIIGVKENYKFRTSGMNGYSENEEIYDSKVFSGIAVKIYTDSTFLNKYSDYADATFKQPTEKLLKEEENEIGFQVVMSIIAAIGGLYYYIINPRGEN